MKRLHKLMTLCALILAYVAGASAVSAAEPSAAAKAALEKDAVCTACHNESWATPVLAIYQTKHGVKSDARTPGCTSCHGESAGHLKEGPGTKPDRTFGKNTATPVDDRNGACLNCHQKDSKRMFWMGSQHQGGGIACASCHQIHAAQDRVRDKRAQPEVCFSCHKEQRALANKPSHHPIPEGKMTCSDCHSTHGSAGPKQLIKDSTNATCYTCHAEKRGPFIHAHQPVTDDCANCHNPHGTTADTLLKTRAPFLCLGCHDPSSHPGNVPGIASNVDMSKNASGAGIGASAGAIAAVPRDNINSSGVVGKTQGLSCMNCHTNIHGSNNPMNSTRAMRFWR